MTSIVTMGKVVGEIVDKVLTPEERALFMERVRGRQAKVCRENVKKRWKGRQP
jgi:hypothetical protein